MSLKEAIHFAKARSLYNELVPVLFVLSIQNYRGYAGFRLNLDKYSAYANEQEVLLKEGCEVYVLKIE